MRERVFVHPHDPKYLVIDTLDENGSFVRTRNVRNPYWRETNYGVR